MNQGQPQTLVIATYFLYFEAVMAFIFRRSPSIGDALVGPSGDFGTADLLNTIGLFLVVLGGAAAGYLIANEQRKGWYLGIGVAALPLLARLLLAARFDNVGIFADPLGLMFDVALFALLVHTQSRNYVRIWFK